MNLLALDLSLTSTGWAAKHGAEPVASGRFTPTTTGVARLAAAVAWLEKMVEVYHPDLVVIEGYAYSAKGRAVVDIGELGGVIRLALHFLGIPFVEIAPTSRAKLATGKGNAGKDEVLVAAVRRLKYVGHSNDEADARWLLEAALHRFGLPGRTYLPELHLKALETIEWPQLLRRSA